MDALDQNFSGQLAVEGQGQNYLKETAKWAKFLSIVGFVFIGLFALMFLVVGFAGGDLLAESGMSGGEVVILFPLLMLAIYFYPLYKLYKFSQHAKNSVASSSSNELTHALGNLKSLYKFMGVLTLIVVIFYGFIFAFMLLGGVASFF